MAYHKVPHQLRHCAHCHQPFSAAHKRRLYCTNSCNTQAYEARKAARNALLAAPPLLAAAPAALPPAASPPEQKVTLDWNLQNILVLGSAAGMVHLSTEVYKFFTTPTPPSLTAQRADPLSWLPPGLLSAASPRVGLELPRQAGSHMFVELRYLGHVLYYQPRQRWLLWRVAPETLLAVLSAAHLDAIAEHLPYQQPEPTRWLDTPPPTVAPRLPQVLG